MASVIIAPGAQIDENDFWVSSAAVSSNERFALQTGSTGGGLLGLGQTLSTYDEYRFEANGYTYRYLGDWELQINNGVLTDSASAQGSYNEVIIEQNGTQIAHLVTDTPLAVDFGSNTGLSLLGLGDLLNPLLSVVIASDSDQAFANIHLAVTPTLPDLAGIPDDLPGGEGTVNGGTSGDDVLTGTVGDDTITGLEGTDSLSGGNGNDVLFGNQGNDTINGEGGNDSLYGGQNNDSLNGGDGNDYVIGGLGGDQVAGGSGDDIIFGGNEAFDPTDDADTIYGGQGSDTIYGNGGGDIIFGGDGIGDLTDGNELVFGGMGNDTISGNAGGDQIFGQRANDTLFGNEGNDFMHGGQENDTLNGGQGNDTLNGGLGEDVLTGGGGSDVFVFTSNQGTDIVADFDFQGGDRLDLSGLNYTAGTDPNGFVTLSLDGGGTIILQGVAGSAFAEDYVV